MDSKALALAARFSYSPNRLGYCGRESANAVFTRCIVKSECAQVPVEVPKFQGLYPYLKTIAEVTGREVFDYKVIEAYWLGNELLGRFKFEDYQVLMKHLSAQGLPDFFVKEVAKRKPQQFIPLHLFNVLHIGVGKITGSVPFTLSSINNCMVRWGKISQKSKVKSQNVISNAVKRVRCRLWSVERSERGYRLVEKEETVEYDPRFVGDLKKGDRVAVHWGWVGKQLSAGEEKNLAQWSRRLVEGLS